MKTELLREWFVKLLVRKILPVMLIALSVVTCSEAAILGPYSGKVVDAETGLPVKGATVVVSWGKATPTPAGAVGEFVEAAMCETGGDGEYHISARMASIGLFSYVDGITFIVYQPGYTGFSRTYYDNRKIEEARLVKLARSGPMVVGRKQYDDFESGMFAIDPHVDDNDPRLTPLHRLEKLLKGLPERELLRARTDWERLFRRQE